MDVEAKLDRDGRGKMTKDLWEFFCAAGCLPGCHICNSDILVDEKFRLKNYAKKDKKSLIASVMICDECDQGSEKLPHHQAFRLIDRAGLRNSDIDWKMVDLGDRYHLDSKLQPIHNPSMGCFVVLGRVIV